VKQIVSGFAVAVAAVVAAVAAVAVADSMLGTVVA